MRVLKAAIDSFVQLGITGTRLGGDQLRRLSRAVEYHRFGKESYSRQLATDTHRGLTTSLPLWVWDLLPRNFSPRLLKSPPHLLLPPHPPLSPKGGEGKEGSSCPSCSCAAAYGRFQGT